MKPSEFMTKALGLRTIHEAILEGDLKRVKRILHQDKSAVNTQTIRDQVTPLHLAVLNGSLATVKLLLLQKASFSIKDKKGYTARQYARSATIRAKKLKQYERLGWQPAKRRNRKARFISTIFREPEALRAILSTNDHPLSGSTILTDGKKLTILQKVVTTSLTFPVQNSTCGFIASYMSAVPQMMALWSDMHTISWVSPSTCNHTIAQERVSCPRSMLGGIWHHTWPIPPLGARNSAPAAEAETDIVERDNDYGELCRQQKFDEGGPMDDFGSLPRSSRRPPPNQLAGRSLLLDGSKDC
ncbi:hypothetical protein NEUTE1DRAFT_100309 [Neurospora tetrasperma FGSC 2508]|uniref:Uncharacterized protein n=1 Tax=Neurospora tetrasperma (strain FGSC 2508 / ATCC MYA-4615 / P0657) TaxID=510951 RepID=F8MKA6_NEUT8|nr:uncharacterized protein NEUTE1DRAFT_100309 [Neurospora tetrasperma FGSC 2508]EGO57390.1 hypothetical protein NEUTE1DRAFT_100309 [Neurospora tetrasperma FGSC 2508]EGZ72354.1 hypothetical protein NEUTE2DRAFT_129731 [Neurospora tetrasperma FGSC 2509]